jgi:uncharacterized protein
MKLFIRLLRSVLFIYLSVGLFLFLLQRDFLYYPTAKVEHEYEIKQFSNDDVILDVIVLNKGKDKAILYFGGNAESVVANASGFKNIFSNHTVYLLNYRGYGGSTGSPTEAALYSDALFLYDEIFNRFDSVSVIGRSLGTGVATYLASTRAINKMILITPYDSIQNIAQKQYPVFPISILLKDKYDSASRVQDIDAETLIILAEHDVVIPMENSEQLIKEFPESQLQVEIIKDATHNSLSSKNKVYYSFLQQFMNSE